MNAFGKAANVELKGSGIHVLTVCPGYVRTDFSANAIKGREAKTVRPSSVRGISVERVARAVLHGYLKQKREVVVPWTMHPGHQGLSVVSGAGGASDGENVAAVDSEVGSEFAPRTYSSSASMPSISAWAWPLPVFFAEAIPSASIFLASSVRSAFASVWAAMK